MTIVYCDFVNGDDNTGDGTAGNPYKTITKASDGLMGGDEVRVAKSPSPSALSGVLTWTNGSASVSTSVDLMGVLAARDFIRKASLNAADYDIWWEISSITSTTITLVKTFRGYTESCASMKLGTTDTGAATYGQNVQVVSSSGDDESTRLEISGGWNLSTELQDGETWFRQTGTTKYGNGLRSNDSYYISLSKCHLLRYSYDLYLQDEAGWSVSHCQFLAAGNAGLTCNASFRGVFSNITSDSTLYFGYSVMHAITADTIVCINGQIHTYDYLSNVVAVNATIHAAAGSISRNISGSLIELSVNPPCKFYNVSGCSVNVQGSIGGANYATLKGIDGAAGEQAWQAGGYAQKNTANARSGSCVEVVPMYPIGSVSDAFEQVFKLAVAASTAKTVGVYMKSSADFDGAVQAALMYKGEFLADFIEWTMTTSYQQFTLTAAADDIDESGVLELWIRVWGETGSVYIDDLS